MRTLRVQYGVMVRALLAVILVVVPLGGLAATPSPSMSPNVEPARDGGVIEGRITSVDYRASTLTVLVPRRGQVALTVMPSTSIQTNDPGYHAITDLRPGERVQIWSSVSAGRYIAQIIRIR